MSITWNGVSSDTIGVVVEKIPNRYVPTRRFSPQEVAGRNGNILRVDKSFPNVEQEYEVYLSAEAQGLPSVARACAEWLMGPDGYCRLEDSYDTTVYREAFLMGGYDLENILNKFGRCTITFSCKPQKYLLTGDTPISIPAGTTTTYTGSSVQFDGITGASITSLSTTIEPTQDLHGYSSPWPAGGGGNVLDPNIKFTAGTYYGGAVLETSDGYNITLSGTPTESGNITTNNIPTADAIVMPAGTYTSVGAILSTYKADGSWYTNRQIGTWTADEPFIIRQAYIQAVAGSPSSGSRFIALAKGSTAPTSWTPYENICPISGRTGVTVYVSPTQDQQDATTYNVDWTTQAGTVYGGTLDVVTGVLTVDRAIKAMSTMTWTRGNRNTADTGRVYHARLSGTMKNLGALVCDTFDFRPYTYPSWEAVPLGVITSASGAYIILCSSQDAVADFQTEIADAQLVYELATPLTYQLTPQEVAALVGENNVWTSSGPVSVTVEAPIGGTVTNPTPFEARPMLTVSGLGEITINGKSIQILESVSDFEIDCEAMEAEDNSKIYCMDFPELSGGENEIVGDSSITSLTVVPRWWTL